MDRKQIRETMEVLSDTHSLEELKELLELLIEMYLIRRKDEYIRKNSWDELNNNTIKAKNITVFLEDILGLPEIKTLICELSRYYLFNMPDDSAPMTNEEAIAQLWHLIKLHDSFKDKPNISEKLMKAKVEALEMGIKALEITEFCDHEEAADE